MNREYRELQVSTATLIFIILGVLILGTVIFFLGVQVGKKQADLMGKTLLSQRTEEKVASPPPVVPVEESQATTTSSPDKGTESAAVPASSADQAKLPAEPKKAEAETPAVSSSRTPNSASQTEPRKTEPTPSSSFTTGSKTSSRVTTPATGGSFFIQVGAFNDRPSAQLAAERFRKLGYNAVVKEPFPRDRKPLYRVWVGGFRTREEAQKVLNEFNASSARRTGYFIVQQ